MTNRKMIIGGASVDAPAWFDVHDPATGDLVGRAPNATPGDLDAAVAAARAAFDSWSQTSDAERRAACAAVAAAIEAHAEELAQLLTREQGKPLDGLGSRHELGGAVVWARHTAGLEIAPKTIQDDNIGRVEMFRRPLGVVGSILPWNAPAMIAVWHILPALRTGNTVVVKPSPHAPLTVMRMVELMNALLPPGVVNLIASDDSTHNIGAAMARHPGIAKIVFTGSFATGSKVMMSAGETMKRLTMELGGNDAAIVLPDVDAHEIAEGLFWGAFINNGQTCAAIKRLYVHDAVYEEVCTALADYARSVRVGPGTEAETRLGPITNRMQFDKVARLVADAATRGRVLCGGAPGEGLFFPPTLVADLEEDAPLVQEEQFGPALPIIRYTDLDAVIERANANDNGLGGSIWTKDIEAARALAGRLECGSVWVNRHAAIQPDAPFGGAKRSGLGVEFGEEGLAEYTQIQVVYS